MKTEIRHIRHLLLALLLPTFNPQLSTAVAQGTAFTYQGRLTESGAPADGTNDFSFTLYNAATGGVTVGASNVVDDLRLTNGLFSVTLDFGAAAFPGSDLWIEIAVRPGTSTGAYTAMTPRQPEATGSHLYC